jgi:heme A synthase
MGSAGGQSGYLRVNRPSRPVMAVVVVGVVMRRLVANITTTTTITTTQPASTCPSWPRL